MSDRMLKTVFEWEHFAIYLSGSMDFAHDGGKGWRDTWTEKLVEIGIAENQIYNPCKKPFNPAQFDLDNEGRIWRECRESEDWERLEATAQQIMHIDLRLVDKADIVLVNMPRMPEISGIKEMLAYDNCSTVFSMLRKMYETYRDMRVPTYGTIHEIVIAHGQRKPIFMVWEGTGLSNCSAWLTRLVGYKNIFSHVDELIQHLSMISQGERAFNANEWLLIEPNRV